MFRYTNKPLGRLILCPKLPQEDLLTVKVDETDAALNHHRDLLPRALQTEDES